jgi:hypothetical protein
MLPIIENANHRINYGEIFWHGSPSKKMEGGNCIHVGAKLAATQALEARIGDPANGEWDGSRQYDKTLIAGKKRLKEIERERGYYPQTGFNCCHDVPEEDYYPSDRGFKAQYSDGSMIPFDCKPIVFPVEIIGKMTNTPGTPHKDSFANSLIKRQLRRGMARSGYFYKNEGEDVGSISAVVPDKSFLKIL